MWPIYCLEVGMRCSFFSVLAPLDLQADKKDAFSFLCSKNKNKNLSVTNDYLSFLINSSFFFFFQIEDQSLVSKTLREVKNVHFHETWCWFTAFSQLFILVWGKAGCEAIVYDLSCLPSSWEASSNYSTTSSVSHPSCCWALWLYLTVSGLFPTIKLDTSSL